MRASLVAAALFILLAPALLTFLPHTVAEAEASPTGDLLAGAAKRDITPWVGTPLFAYTARHFFLASGDDLSGGEVPRYVDQRLADPTDGGLAKTFLKSTGIHTRLYAQAMVFQDGQGDLVALVLADLGGIPGELHKAVAERVQEAGVPLDAGNLLLGGTHTHGGPGAIFQSQGYALLGGDEYDPRVFSLIADQTAAAIVDAYGDMEPATVALGTADLSGASRQRSGGAQAQNPGYDGDEVQADARLLRVDSAVDGLPIGVVTSFGAHGTLVDDGDLLLDGDNQAVAARMLARSIAADAGVDEEDVPVVYLNGALGDVSPVGSGGDLFETLEDAGARQAVPLHAAWAELDGAGEAKADVDARSRFVCLCGQDVEAAGYEGFISPIASLGAPIVAGDGVTAPFEIVPGHGNKFPTATGGGLVPHIVRVQAVRVGPWLMTTIPGEPSVALADGIEAELRTLVDEAGASGEIEAVDVVGVANDYVSYMSTVPEYDAQHYEGAFNLFGRATGPLFHQESTFLTTALLEGEPVEEAYAGVLVPTEFDHPSVPLVHVEPDLSTGLVTAGVTDEAVVLVWDGGDPLVDHVLDAARVRLLDATTGDVVVDDLGYKMAVRYHGQDGSEHLWSATVPLRHVDASTVQWAVEGLTMDATGAVVPYGVDGGIVTVA